MKKYKLLLSLILIIVATSILCACADSNEKFQSYKVEFVSNGGNEIQTIYSSKKNGKIQEPQEPQREGYEFAGWFKDNEFTKKFDFEDIIDKDIILHAKWNAQVTKCLIRFNANDKAFGSMDDIEQAVDNVIKLPINNFSRIGYKFMGWAHSKDGIVKNDDGGWLYVEKTPILVLYAVWEPNQYNVQLDLNGGESNIEKVTAVFDKTLPIVQTPTKIGYVLIGFFTEPNGQGAMYYGNNMMPNTPWKITEDITLFAHWAVAENKISFNGNGSTDGQMSKIDATTFKKVRLPQNTFSKTGYAFLKWNTKADGSGVSYDKEQEFVMPAVYGELELFAIWQANRYFLVFDNNIDNQREKVAALYDQNALIIENPFNKRGYEFLGWNIKNNGSGDIYLPNESVKNLTANENREIIFYAMWKAQTFVINLNKQGGVGGTIAVNATYDRHFPFAVAPTKVGYVFGGYYKQIGGEGTQYYNENMTPMNVSDLISTDEPYAYWIPRRNNLVFNGNNATSGDNQSISAFTDSLVVMPQSGFYRLGYTFLGWSIVSDGTGQVVESGNTFQVVPRDEEVVLFAIWSANKVIISFNGNQNQSGSVENAESFSDKNIILPNNGFMRRGYSFAGWSRTLAGEVIVKSGEPYKTPIENDLIVLYAIWSINQYAIYYELNGGVNSANNPSYYTVISEDVVFENPTRSGYAFKGWKNTTLIQTGSVGNVSVTAQWEVIKYNIYYILNGGQNNSRNPSSYTVESPTIYLQHPAKAGFQFEGWTEGGVIDNGSIGNKTFTAEWNGKRYTINYILNGGINGDGNPSNYTVDSQTIILKRPTKKGYDFKGWSEGDLIPIGSTGDKTFTANWKIVEYTVTYFLDEGINSDSNPQAYTIESYTITLESPVKTGYAFNGWKEGSTISQGSTGNKTFTAVWIVQTYYILYGMPENAQNGNNPKTYNIESETIILQDATMQHYNFVRWEVVTVDAENNVIHTPVTSILKGTVGDLNLLAIFEQVGFNITYDLSGGTNHIDNPFAYDTDSAEIIIQDPTRDGYFSWVGKADTAVLFQPAHQGIFILLPCGKKLNIQFNMFWMAVIMQLRIL